MAKKSPELGVAVERIQQNVRVGLWQNGFFADFYFWAAGFSRQIFFLLIFVGKSAQKNPPEKSPAKSSKIYTTKIPDTPKGPFRTKNTTAIAKIVNYYAVVFLLRPSDLVRRGPFFERKNVCNFQEVVSAQGAPR